MREFIGLSLTQKWLLVKTAALLLVIRLALKLFRFEAVLKFFSANHSENLPDDTVVKRVIWAIEVASSHLPGKTTCLPRALATHYLLSQSNQPASLRIGVRLEGRELQAHAWVENPRGVVIGKLPDLSRYTPLPLDAVNRHAKEVIASSRV